MKRENKQLIVLAFLLVLTTFCNAQTLDQILPDPTANIVTVNSRSFVALNALGYIDYEDRIYEHWQQALNVSGAVMDVNSIKWFTAVAIIDFDFNGGMFASVNGVILRGDQPQIVLSYLDLSEAEIEQQIFCLSYRVQTGRESCMMTL